MEKSFRVAVIVPVYNVAPYLPAALDSLLAQTHDCWEAFIIDDGSTDGSGGIADRLAAQDARLTVLHTENAGPGAARNRGLDMAFSRTGPYDAVAFLDPDDCFSPELLERAVRAMQENKADVVMFGYSTVRNDGTLRQKPFVHGSGWISEDEFHEAVYSRGAWLAGNASGGMVWKFLFSSDVVKKVRFPVERDMIEDEPFLSRLEVHGVYLIAESLYLYKMRKDSLIHANRASLRVLRARLRSLAELDAAGMSGSFHAEVIREGICTFLGRIHANTGCSHSEDCLPLLRTCALAVRETAARMAGEARLPSHAARYIEHLAELPDPAGEGGCSGQHPALSVVLAAGHDAAAFRRTLDSARRQALPDLEILCMVPACAKDGPDAGNRTAGEGLQRIAEAAAAADSRVHAVPFAMPDAGGASCRAAAWNAGLDHASGEFAVFVRPGAAFATPESCPELAAGLRGCDADAAICAGGSPDSALPQQFSGDLEQGRMRVTSRILPSLSPTVANKAFRLADLRLHAVRFAEASPLAEAIFVAEYFSLMRMAAWLDGSLCTETPPAEDARPEDHLKAADLIFEFQQDRGILDKSPEPFWRLASLHCKKALALARPQQERLFCTGEMQRLLTKWRVPAAPLWMQWLQALGKEERTQACAVFDAMGPAGRLAGSLARQSLALAEKNRLLSRELRREKAAHTEGQAHGGGGEQAAHAPDEERAAPASGLPACLQAFDAFAYVKYRLLARILPLKKFRERLAEQQKLYDLIKRGRTVSSHPSQPAFPGSSTTPHAMRPSGIRKK